MQWEGPIAGAVGIGALMGPERFRGARGGQKGPSGGPEGAFKGALGGRQWEAQRGSQRRSPCKLQCNDICTYDSAIAAMETRCYTSTKSSEVRIYRSSEILATVRLERRLYCVLFYYSYFCFFFLLKCDRLHWIFVALVCRGNNNALNGVQNMISQLNFLGIL